MENKPKTSHGLFGTQVTAVATLLSIFVIGQSIAHAQSFYGNLGPASFSKNWGTHSRDTSYQPPVVVMKRPDYTSPSATANNNVVATLVPSSPTSLPGAISPLQPTVRGHRAVIRHGIAYAPEDAPLNVKRAIWATNTLVRKPYHWGGGHDSFFDSGYDCSGTVSFALHYAGLVSSPLDSRSLMSFGERGRGRWITVYARNGHTFAVIAGLRLDTTGFYGDEGPRWRPDQRSTWGFEARHPVGL